MRRVLALALTLLLACGTAWAGSFEDFFRAMKNDRDDVVRELLLRGFDPNTRNENGLYGLYIALREPSPRVARELIAWPHTDVNIRTDQGETPLMLAALTNQLELARLLIARGADVNQTGWTPLHYAATNGHLEMIGLLLDNSAYIDAESPNGSTPLMMAARYGSPQAVKLLLEQGADPNLRNQLGLTALDFARQGGRPDSIEILTATVARRPEPLPRGW